MKNIVSIMKEFINLSDTDLNEKEKKILMAACVVFSEKGFSAATTSEIARIAGVAEGTIFRYYQTKKGILKALLMQLIEIFSEKVAVSSIERIVSNTDNKSEKEIFKEIIYDRMKLIDENFPLVKVVLSEAMFHDDIKELLYEKLITKAYLTLEKFYKKMVENETARVLPSRIVISNTVGSIMFFILSRKLFNIESKGSNLDAEIDVVIDIIINGITKQ